MAEYRDQRVNDTISRAAAEFFQRESNNTSIITVTRVQVSGDYKRATIYITVLPENLESQAMDFAKRKRTDLKHYIRERLPISQVPFVDVEIDKGEKLRYRIDEIANGK
jgi:ribosome-binding factor A